MLRFKLMLLVVWMLFVGCVRNGGKVDYLPSDAISITDKGNGWYTFELDGKKFLYMQELCGNAGWSAITEISE